MMRKIFAICIVTVLTFAASNSFAMMDGGKGTKAGKGEGASGRGILAGDDMPGHLLHMVHLLDLTDEQEKDIEKIHFGYKKDSIRKNADIDVAEVELREILAKEPVSMENAEKKIRAIANFRADLSVMHLKTQEAVKAKLTPEQLEKLKKHIASEMKDKMEKKMGKGEGKSKMAGKAKKKCASDGDDASAEKDDDDEKAGADASTEEKKADESHH